jgi:hypothetical protein
MKLMLAISDKMIVKSDHFPGVNSTNRPSIVISDQNGFWGAKSADWH